MDDTTKDILKTFYKGRSKPDSVYDYSAEGDLVEMDKRHVSIVRTLLALNEYRPITMEEHHEMEETRKEAIAIATQQYDDAKKRLRQAVMKPERSDSEYLALMREIRELDDALFRTRFPMRYINKLEGVKWKQVLFDEMEKDTRTIPYPLRVLETSPFLLTDMYVRIGKQAQKPLMTVKEIKKSQKAEKVAAEAGRPLLFFTSDAEEDEHGFLTLDWRVNLSINGVNYHSARQALAVELARLFDDEKHYNEFMEMDSPEGIRYTLEDVPGDMETHRAKWLSEIIKLLYAINTEKFSKYPALAAQLLETQNAILAAYEPDDLYLGIGLSPENPLAQNQKQWTGQNLLGKALMDIRDLIRTQEEAVRQKMEKPRTMVRKKKPTQETSLAASSATSSSAAASSVATIPSMAISSTAPSTTSSIPAISMSVPSVTSPPSTNMPSSSAATSLPSTVNVQPSMPRVMRRKPKIESSQPSQ